MVDSAFAGPTVGARLGLGLAALGRPGYVNLGHAQDLGPDPGIETLRRRTWAVLDAAWQHGVRDFDTARSYGHAEQFLGSWLRARGIAAPAVRVSSKWGYTYTAAWRVVAEQHEVKDHSLATLQRQWAETRAQLGGHVQLYQIHSATLDSGVLERAEVLQHLAQLRDAHGVQIGLTLSGPAQALTLQRALALQGAVEFRFDAVQATWNVLETSCAAALRQAKAAGLRVIIKEALANGRLTPRAAGSPAHEVLSQHARRLQTTVDALALAAALAQPWADVVLSGAATVAQLAANARARAVQLDAACIEALTALQEPPIAYWQTRAALPWN